ncbi:hypothetical protein GWI33_017931 [Rhynchophorus ferrugineus]|uniref:Uncharacterized protein n=1 Tax=Rhynchophorus ferrugineus TaxID=354439 RepID=A0A834M726_RHYFE|nr:hypothetical protein GWI33_017931 [Rhynchophorus ferrugineus]
MYKIRNCGMNATQIFGIRPKNEYKVVRATSTQEIDRNKSDRETQSEKEGKTVMPELKVSHTRHSDGVYFYIRTDHVTYDDRPVSGGVCHNIYFGVTLN